jgi:hypothetical protein
MIRNNSDIISAREKEKTLFLDRTIEIWQPYFSRKISREDARQIVENATGVFKILWGWENKENLHKSS